ncbi:MAG TPA: hypothetical protein VEH27_19420 [Methylomirabilota bacterium]|nr:hypothetical protein [Methylomirabilota bacterium]
MAENAQTFSESWYRIANQRISLRPAVRVRRQNFRGQRWIILENPLSNQFFRLRPAAYEFVARLRPERTVEEVWKECMDRFPDEAPGQEAVIQLLSQLYFSNLLQYDVAADTAKLFERYKRVKQRELTSKLMNIMFLRVPLLDPDEFLNKTIGFIGKLISPIGFILWAAVVGWGIKLGMDNWDKLGQQSEGVLNPSNLLLLYAGLVIIKTLHEFGHAYFTKKYGGEVHVMGVLFMIFTPTPYVDATSSWGFRSRRQRIMVGAAGMIVEVFVAAVALIVWANTAPGALHSICYNMVFIAGVSTILFNINPLMRFDGYYILSDLLDVPNLHQRSIGQLKHVFEHYVFGIKRSESPAVSTKEAWLLGVFGALAMVYRIFVFTTILFFLADRLLLLGILMALICGVTWLIVPIVKFGIYLANSPRLERTRPRAVAISAAAFAVILVLLNVVPFPSHFRAPGVLEAKQWSQVMNEAPGVLAQVIAQPGAPVTVGQPLMRFTNKQLEHEAVQANAALVEVEARILQARKDDSASLKPLESRKQSVLERVQRVKRDQEALVVKARHAGVWVAPQIDDAVGRWLTRGTPLGLVVDPSSFEFVATVLQEDVDTLFVRAKTNAQVRLIGEADTAIAAGNIRKIPAEKHTLPSPAIGWAGGGEVAVSANDPQGSKAAEPFFEVRADLQPLPEVALVHGRAGKIRFNLESEPLLPRWIRRFRQLIQKRYQL